MNTELYIARKIFLSKENKSQLSRNVVNLAVLAIGLGMAVIILAVAIVSGFQNEIEAKVDGFAAHAQVVNYDSNNSYETSPIQVNRELVEDIVRIDNVQHVQAFATKPGIVKVGDEIQGVVAKGVPANFDWSFFEQNKVSGEAMVLSGERSNQVWLSLDLANLLKLKLGDKFLMYFLNEGEQLPRMRQFVLGGIYRTGLAEFDQMFMLVDLRHIQNINDWEESQISGYDVFVHDLDQLALTIREINTQLVSHISEKESLMQIIDIKEKYSSIFDWLGLLDMNSVLIQVLMILVASFNMISGLLVIILERTRMIGILKSMGASTFNIRKIFLYISGLLVSKGLLWGNIVGIGICLLQKHFQLLPLSPDTYFIDAVPIHIDFTSLLLLNLSTFMLILLMLVLPSYVVGRISPEKTIRFE